jgi:hypothetical protein
MSGGIIPVTVASAIAYMQLQAPNIAVRLGWGS